MGQHKQIVWNPELFTVYYCFQKHSYFLSHSLSLRLSETENTDCLWSVCYTAFLQHTHPKKAPSVYTIRLFPILFLLQLFAFTFLSHPTSPGLRFSPDVRGGKEKTWERWIHKLRIKPVLQAARRDYRHDKYTIW